MIREVLRYFISYAIRCGPAVFSSSLFDPSGQFIHKSVKIGKFVQMLVQVLIILSSRTCTYSQMF